MHLLEWDQLYLTVLNWRACLYRGWKSSTPKVKKFHPHTLAFGRPAKVIRELTDEDYKEMDRIYREYREKGQYYKSLQSK